MSENFRYDAFISYRHVEPDRAYAKWLHKALETYRVPKDLVKKGYPARIRRVFRDEEELPASSDLSTEINSALKGSKFLIVICSPRIVESIWCDAEVKKFRDLGRHDKILALLIEGEPSESFLPALCEIRKSVIKEDGTEVEEIEAVEPLAADVRPSREESSRELKYLAKLRLSACILGCKFDDLRKREMKRRQQRIATAFLILTLLLAAFITLTLWALNEHSAAVEQKGIAEKKTHEAEQERDKAVEAHQAVQKMLSALKTEILYGDRINYNGGVFGLKEKSPEILELKFLLYLDLFIHDLMNLYSLNTYSLGSGKNLFQRVAYYYNHLKKSVPDSSKFEVTFHTARVRFEYIYNEIKLNRKKLLEWASFGQYLLAVQGYFDKNPLKEELYSEAIKQLQTLIKNQDDPFFNSYKSAISELEKKKQ